MDLRVARHTHNLGSVIDFYTKIIGLEIIGKFNNHDGYDGVFLGKKSCSWHLEFTTSANGAHHLFDPDDLLVFYPSTTNEYDFIINSIASNSIEIHVPTNPYWQKNGILVHDPDGYGIIISPLRIIE